MTAALIAIVIVAAAFAGVAIGAAVNEWRATCARLDDPAARFARGDSVAAAWQATASRLRDGFRSKPN
jgi:hypothetical protein